MKMNYIKFGEGDRTMLILPGISLTPVCDNPEPVIEAYKMFTNDFTVYLFDYPSDIDENYTDKQLADDIVTKINELGLKDIYLYGVSMGGMCSQNIILKHPELVKKLVIASSTSNFTNVDLDNWNKVSKEKVSVKLAIEFCKLIYSEEFYKNIEAIIPEYYGNIPEEQMKNFEIYAGICSRFNVSDKIENIDVPTFIIHSKKDKLVPYKEAVYMSEKIKNSELYLYEDYSHAIYDEAPDIKDRILDFFLK